MESTKIHPLDEHFSNEAAPFHLLHRYTKWYRVEVEDDGGLFGTSGIRIKRNLQQRHCIICEKVKRRNVIIEREE